MVPIAPRVVYCSGCRSCLAIEITFSSVREPEYHRQGPCLGKAETGVPVHVASSASLLVSVGSTSGTVRNEKEQRREKRRIAQQRLLEDVVPHSFFPTGRATRSVIQRPHGLWMGFTDLGCPWLFVSMNWKQNMAPDTLSSTGGSVSGLHK